MAVRFLSAEPLIEDISGAIDLIGFGWLIVGGESGGGPEYLWDSTKDWRKEFNTPGRRTMRVEWAQSLLAKSRAADIPFFFKQNTAFRSGTGEDALGRLYQEFPPPPFGTWAGTKS
jgi:protein gp37